MRARYAAAIAFVLCATTFPFLADSARADQTAIAFDTDQFWSLSGGAGNFGWQFTARSDIQISSLGLYDNFGIFGGGFPGDGLLESHVIGIWDVADPSIPLVSALIPAGTGAPLLDGFRFVDIGRVTLTANHEYVIAALYPSPDLTSQDFTTGSTNNPGFVLTVSPKIEFGGFRGNNNSSMLAFPEIYVPGLLGAFGPNFTIVPEDSDLCPDTPPGVPVNSDGCSIAQLVPCAGPVTGGTWRNHGEYVSTVSRVAEMFREQGLITGNEFGLIISGAAKSKCGK